MSQRKGHRYLYECDECHERRYVDKMEANRAAKPRCKKCGCTRLEIVSEDARKDRARLQAERIAGTGGSLKLASGLDNVHRAVR